MSQTYLIDGVNLEDPDGRWRLERATKLPAVGNQRVAALEIPGRDGVIAVRQGTGPGQVGLSIVIIGDDPGEMEESRLALVSILHAARVVTWSPAPGVYRHADVSEVAVSEPVRGLRTAKIAASLTVQPFWHAGDPIVAERTLANGIITFGEFEGVTGKLADAIVRIKGPLNSLSLTDPVSGTGLVTGQALTAAQYLYVDTASWDGWVSTSDSAWSPSGTARFVDFPAGGQLALWPGMVPVEVARNVVTNPSFEAVGGLTEVQRNFFLNPRPLDWLPLNQQISFQAGVPGGGSRSYALTDGAAQVTLEDAVTSTGDTIRFTGWVNNAAAVDDGQTYTLSFDADFLGTSPEQWGFRRWLYGPDDLVRDSSTVPAYIDPATGRFCFQFQASVPGETIHRVSITLRGTNIPAGGGIRLTNARFSHGTDAAYFDGDLSPDSDLTPSWTGTPHESPSILSARAVTGYGIQGEGRKIPSSQHWASSGSRSIRVLREGTPTQAIFGVVVPPTNYAALRGQQVTILATCHIPEGYDAGEDLIGGTAASRAIFLHGRTDLGIAQAPPMPGTYPLRLTVPLPTDTSATIRLGGGGAIGQSVYWDDLAIIAGEYTGPWFGSGFAPPGYETSVVDGVTILSKPDPARKAPQLIAAGTGFTSASRVAIRSRRWYL